MTKREEEKLLDHKEHFKVHCKCGHYVYIYPIEKVNEKICSWCGKYVYLNPREEFRERLGKKYE